MESCMLVRFWLSESQFHRLLEHTLHLGLYHILLSPSDLYARSKSACLTLLLAAVSHHPVSSLSLSLVSQAFPGLMFLPCTLPSRFGTHTLYSLFLVYAIPFIQLITHTHSNLLLLIAASD